jgi:hypothetical protein
MVKQNLGDLGILGVVKRRVHVVVRYRKYVSAWILAHEHCTPRTYQG